MAAGVGVGAAILAAMDTTVIIMGIGTITLAGIGTGTATITIGTIQVTMTGTAAVIMVTMMMIDVNGGEIPCHGGGVKSGRLGGNANMQSCGEYVNF